MNGSSRIVKKMGEKNIFSTDSRIDSFDVYSSNLAFLNNLYKCTKEGYYNGEA
jgi:hypothetical protein